jgi:hypothetical protein
LRVDGQIRKGYAIHLFHFYGDSSISVSYTTSWQHLTNGFGTMWNNIEDDNGETQSIRFYNITQAAGLPTAGALTTRSANNFGTIPTSAYGSINAGDKIILQYKSDASGTSVYKNGTIKIFKTHE